MTSNTNCCSICGGELGALGLEPCYDCKYNDETWCYKHHHFSHDLVKCPQCIEEKKVLQQKGMPIGL